jgi:23S rRNA (cytosine1962-C5)-methyltransferase
MYPTVVLNRGKDQSVLRYHPWIFSGAVRMLPEGLREGDIVRVTDESGRYLCTGYYNDSSIIIRILSFSDEQIDSQFWVNRFRSAIQVRAASDMLNREGFNAYRLINGEGDGIPGLIADMYNGHLVLQFHTIGLTKQAKALEAAAWAVLEGNATSIHLKAADKARGFMEERVHGETIIEENGIRMAVDLVHGQKTGFFLDQRDNRMLLGKLSTGKNVLNTFCYTGGFSLHALKGGASSVVSVDSSAPALKLLEKNLEINGLNDSVHQSVCTDAVEYIQQMKNRFDIIILDPPAFAKSVSARHNAIQAYKRINKAAFRNIAPGGLLFTFSCSQVVDVFTFRQTVYSAALESGRRIRILHTLGAGADHPVSVYHPEGSYLKGFILSVE